MIRDTEDLKALLGVPYTEEQLDAITAPLEPAVIVAGAQELRSAGPVALTGLRCPPWQAASSAIILRLY